MSAESVQVFDWWKKHSKAPLLPPQRPDKADPTPPPQQHAEQTTPHIQRSDETTALLPNLDEATAHLPRWDAIAPADPNAPRLPERIGHYRVLGALGTGGMAQVYLVEYDDGEAQPQRYALKTLLSHDPNDHQTHDRFMREIQICIKLRHPNVCYLVDWDIDNGTPFIVMELLEGELLHDRIMRLAPMPVALARPIIVQLLHGLEAIHKAGVIHRDLKPGNVFVMRDGTIKIMDFGISKKVGLKSLTEPGTSLGTPEYISPEQVVDTHHVDHRTDLFNVGLIFYAMLTGHLPIEPGAVTDILVQLVRGTLTPVSRYREDLPPGVEVWLSRMLAQDKDLRFPTAREAVDSIPF